MDQFPKDNMNHDKISATKWAKSIGDRLCKSVSFMIGGYEMSRMERCDKCGTMRDVLEEWGKRCMNCFFHECREQERRKLFEHLSQKIVVDHEEEHNLLFHRFPRVVPLPIDGGHRLLYDLIVSYLVEGGEDHHASNESLSSESGGESEEENG